MRLPDWAQRLDALVGQALPRPFEWGTHDCCLWAADAVLAQTGQDPAADLRGTYADAAGAARALRAVGGLRGAGARCGAPIEPLRAVAGDVGLVRDGRHPLLAVFSGQVWLAVSVRGLITLPQSAASAAWGVGHA